MTERCDRVPDNELLLYYSLSASRLLTHSLTLYPSELRLPPNTSSINP